LAQGSGKLINRIASPQWLNVFICISILRQSCLFRIREFDDIFFLTKGAFFGRIRKWICDPKSYRFFDTKKITRNPKKDYFVVTRQAGGTQYLYQNDISLVLP